mmetsp:Transcript_4770/g.17121  ORF Transcript_4770/g.17121 Transcript_4770/m.17121 type:complete len:218 (+) Transcript_4770:855-1508(+)
MGPLVACLALPLPKGRHEGGGLHLGQRRDGGFVKIPAAVGGDVRGSLRPGHALVGPVLAVRAPVRHGVRGGVPAAASRPAPGRGRSRVHAGHALAPAGGRPLVSLRRNAGLRRPWRPWQLGRLGRVLQPLLLPAGSAGEVHLRGSGAADRRHGEHAEQHGGGPDRSHERSSGAEREHSPGRRGDHHIRLGYRIPSLTAGRGQPRHRGDGAPHVEPDH